MEDPMFFGSMNANTGDYPGSQYGGYSGIGTYGDRSVYVNGWKIGRNCDGPDVEIEDLCNGCFCGASIRQKIYGWEVRDTSGGGEKVVSRTQLRGTLCKDVHPQEWCDAMEVGLSPEGTFRGEEYAFAPFWIDIFRNVNNPTQTYSLNCTWARGDGDCRDVDVWNSYSSSITDLSANGNTGSWSRALNRIWTFEKEVFDTGITTISKHKDAAGGTSDVTMEYELMIAAKDGVKMPGHRRNLCVNLEKFEVGSACPNLQTECPSFFLQNGPVGTDTYIWEDNTNSTTSNSTNSTGQPQQLKSVLMHKSTIELKNSDELWVNGGDEICLNLGLHPSLGEWGATSIVGNGYGAELFKKNKYSGYWFNGNLSKTFLDETEIFSNFSFQVELKNEWYDYAGKLDPDGFIDSMVYSNIGKFCSPKTNTVEQIKLRIDMNYTETMDDGEETPWMLKACFPREHYMDDNGKAIDTWIVLDPVAIVSEGALIDGPLPSDDLNVGGDDPNLGGDDAIGDSNNRSNGSKLLPVPALCLLAIVLSFWH